MNRLNEGVPVVWLGTYLGGASVLEFEEFWKEEGFTVEFVEEFKDTEDHSNILFLLKDNVGKFAMFRLQTTDLKWWEDYIVNYNDVIPQEIKAKYNVPLVEDIDEEVWA